jgi:hypothetical protein
MSKLRESDQSVGASRKDQGGTAGSCNETGHNVGRRWVVATIGLGIFSPLVLEGLDMIAGTNNIVGGSDAIRRREKEALMGLAEAFPYPLVNVPVADALTTWEEMRSGPGTPVILGDPEEIGLLMEFMGSDWDGQGTAEEILAKASAFAFPDDLHARRQAEMGEAMKFLSDDPKAREFVQSLSEIGAVIDGGPELGTWPEDPPADAGLSFPDKYEVSNGEVVAKKVERVMIATFPTDDWTEVFAYAGFGGWNACPWPHEHVAAFRHWTARYRLELVSMSHDTLQLRAARRPETREEALTLAREQYDYCPDLGEQSLSELAASLMVNDWWFFWWD